MNSDRFDSGLSAFTVQDLRHPTRLREAILNKLHALPPGRFAHACLEQDVRLVTCLIGDAVCGEYRGLRLTALADFINALHYFLKVFDRRPDTWEGGYMDDLAEMVKVLETHQDVITDYRAWLAGDPYNRASPTWLRRVNMAT